MKRRKGKGILQDIDGWLKRTKILSSVGNVLLPIAGGAIGAFGGPTGSAVGAALGSSANNGLASLGYGRRKHRRRGRGGLYNTGSNLPSAMLF